MSHRLHFSAALLIGLWLTAYSLPAFADPPARVGRVSRVDGAVTVTGLERGTIEMVTATANYPIAEGMRFSSMAGSRVELDFGTLSARIDGRTDVEILALDEKTVGLRLTLGSIDVRVRALGDDERVTLGTSDGQVVLTKVGAYRVDAPGPGASSAGDAPPRGLTHLAVFEGVAQLHSPHGSDDVFAGEAVDVDSPHGTLHYGRADTLWLDDWASEREQEIAAAAAEAARYVDTDIAGAAQLSDAGAWEETPDYGAVWYPDTVPADWAPYEYGTWTWIAPWGWTWVDDQPWGFAPFHYGRWVHDHGRWGWAPGARHHRHVYVPAVVNFIGDHHERHNRPNSWVPLAPSEPYTPPYDHSGAYVRDINADRGAWRRDGRSNGHNPGRNTNDAADNTNRNGVITATTRLPRGAADDHDDRRQRRHAGNDNRVPVFDEIAPRQPQPAVLAPTGGVTPMTTNPAGRPPAGPGASPLAPRIDVGAQHPDNDHYDDRRRFWNNGNPVSHNVPTPALPLTTPGTVDVNGAGRFQRPTIPPQPNVVTAPQIPLPAAATAPATTPAPTAEIGAPRFTPGPRWGNPSAAPADTSANGRFRRPNPAGPTPQMPATPVQTFQPPTPIQTPRPTSPPPSGNPGQGNVGQGNFGQGNVGTGNFGQPAAGGYGSR